MTNIFAEMQSQREIVLCLKIIRNILKIITKKLAQYKNALYLYRVIIKQKTR